MPLWTIALMLAAVALPFVYSATADDGAFFGWVLVGSPALGAIGAVVAWRSRGLRAPSRSRWAVVSVLTGLLTVPMAYVVATLVEAVEWTVNGPPS
ncbi:hypothetical protein [Frigoribacterium sp. PvP032]|uniref:hypothetical protein n=1 Tax=Frigoribacterium sp. PvP032 TaxID=2806589 RepID=UPI001AE84340|nr:hypothetical protein [Frigoribacterium sp. PvP032]MBP1190476.1 VIT1/CCC1 family predicted Fe2+/Mn2+ transporter [Frigoribacterium sp. PvP032]